MNKRIDVTKVMEAEDELTRALKEWADAGGPVMRVVDAIGTVIDERVRVALIRHGVVVDRSDDI